ncbi:Protein of unknown function [Streptococcus thermophilus]|nr:Protein of unknown function [Streptococcus thermophilus]
MRKAQARLETDEND